MLKKGYRHWKIILAVFCILFMMSTPILWKYRYHLKNLFVIRLSNAIELEDNSTLLAIFSFKDLNQSQLVKKSVHYKIKLVESSGIPISRDDINEINNPAGHRDQRQLTVCRHQESRRSSVRPAVPS